MTKEEILKKYYQPKMHWNYVNKPQVLLAMQEYTDQETASLKAENERLKKKVVDLEWGVEVLDKLVNWKALKVISFDEYLKKHF